MAKNVVYFARGEGASIVWNPAENNVLAQCEPISGLFATAQPKVAKVLRKMGYKEVTEKQIKAFGLTLPEVPDRVDYSARESRARFNYGGTATDKKAQPIPVPSRRHIR